MDLHGQIMNLPFVEPADVSAYKSEYAAKLGHRDARHAAAELALNADACIDALRSALLVMRGEALPLKKHAIQQAEDALAAFDGRVLVSG